MSEATQEDMMAAMNSSFDHAMRVLLDAQRTLTEDLNVAPPALASALAASYVTYVSALVAASGLPKEEVMKSCKAAIDTMDQFIDVAYDRMVKQIDEENK